MKAHVSSEAARYFKNPSVGRAMISYIIDNKEKLDEKPENKDASEQKENKKVSSSAK